MSSSLFELISRAGSASLDELRARSSVDDTTLANTVGSMVASGAVTLTAIPGHETPEAKQFISEIVAEKGQNSATGTVTIRDHLIGAVKTALHSADLAQSISATVTAKGFKLFL